MTRKDYIDLLEAYIEIDEAEIEGKTENPELKGYYMGCLAMEKMFLGFLKTDEKYKAPWEK